ncbi:NAD(P)/FAD-dependent oxidoreductase [Pseudactinotalea terrae]|uniref:NAD(P)/FAD-dependent oxidoreductase n=1 Tax=Pseudactinotalea terrae TaxID=1743262 RepID=UPI0012E1FE1B|nr:FAD-dependent oxidoreductase [Pseudactinotalea terrae]
MTLPTTAAPSAPVDVLVVGAGPAGYTAALYAARSGLSVRVLCGYEPGGALTTTTQVENFPGFPTGVHGPELMEAFGERAQRHGAELLLEQVTELELTGDLKTVTTEDRIHTARTVVLATGAAHKHLGVPGEQLPGVAYCATCDGVFFTGRPVVVVGGGDTACEEALYLAGVASSVTMLVRSDRMRASAAMQARVLADPRITIRFDSPVIAVLGTEKVAGVQLAAGTVLDADAVFVAIGHTPRSDLVAGQVALDVDGYVLTAPGGALSDGATTTTSVAGVFAAGDLTDRRYRQAITAAGSGCQAAVDAHRWLTGTR